MKTIANLGIGLIVMAVLYFSGAPKWANIGFALVTFHIYAAADFVVESIKANDRASKGKHQ